MLCFSADLPADEEDDDPDADPEYNVLAEPEPDPEDDHVLPVRVPSMSYFLYFYILLLLLLLTSPPLSQTQCLDVWGYNLKVVDLTLTPVWSHCGGGGAFYDHDNNNPNIIPFIL